MTRIIAGNARSLQLQVPKSGTRPTSDRVREAMFSTLEAWDVLRDAVVLDLFAGSGALGLEAASRGAKSVTFIEKHPPAATILKTNVTKTQQALVKTQQSSPKTQQFEVHRSSAQTFLAAHQTATRWSLVFIDPPYDFDDTELSALLAALAPTLAADAVVMVERSSRSTEPVWPDGVEPLKHRRYGETTLWWAEKPDQASV